MTDTMTADSEKRFSMAIVRLSLALNFADAACAHAKIKARDKSVAFVASKDAPQYAGMVELVKEEYVAGCGETAWEHELRDTLGEMGHSVESMSRMLGRPGKYALNQHLEGLTTFREFTYWVTSETATRSHGEFG